MGAGGSNPWMPVNPPPPPPPPAPACRTFNCNVDGFTIESGAPYSSRSWCGGDWGCCRGLANQNLCNVSSPATYSQLQSIYTSLQPTPAPPPPSACRTFNCNVDGFTIENTAPYYSRSWCGGDWGCCRGLANQNLCNVSSPATYSQLQSIYTSLQTPTCASPCQNGGTCSGVNTCTCAAGWTDAQCQTPTCASACQNGGTCSSPNTCTCAAGWTGAQCQTSQCAASPCQNGGTCSGVNTCTCPTDWTGAQCQTPTCASACQNGGTCSSPNTCTCAAGWTGAQCQTSQCAASPCQNGGTCSGVNTCKCAAGWTGAQCQTATCDPRLKSIVLTNGQGAKIVPTLVEWYDPNSAVAKAFGTVIPYTILNPSLIPAGYECDWLPLAANPQCYTFDAAAWNGTATAPTFKITLEKETVISSAEVLEYTATSNRKFAVKLYYLKDNKLTEYIYTSSGAVSTVFASVTIQ